MALFVSVLVFLLVSLAVIAAGYLLTYRQNRLRERLGAIKAMSEEADTEDMLGLPFTERVVMPVLNDIGRLLGRLAPHEIRNRLEKKILYADTPWNLNAFSLLAVMTLLGLSMLVLTLLLMRLSQAEGSYSGYIVVILTLIGFFLPYSAVNLRCEARQLKIRRALPDVLDLLLVSVEAGLGFDMALKRVIQQMPGPLSAEIKRALDEIRMGGSRETALRGIARRTGVSELSSFISSVIQAEQLGSNIAGTLRVQSDFMRQKRKQRAEEMAMKAPVKLIFPLLFFIFPALFVVVLGPAVINILKFFATTL